MIREGQYVNLHTHRNPADDSEWVLRSLKSDEYPPDPYAEVFYSAGIHPWELDKVDISSAIKKIQLATENCQVLALGETGIDLAIDTPLKLQEKVFDAHVTIAELIGIPVILHVVKSYQQVIAYMNEHNPSVPMILHGFRGNQQLAEDLLKVGLYLSFGDPLLMVEKVQEAWTSIPLERLFLETDEAETPISEIYMKAAELKEIEVHALREEMRRKTIELFSR